jgi:phosphopantothenoylcysteine synthetase/decarboxylase
MTPGSLRSKRVLITGGPTWAAIDDVRVISNISTGRMSLILARDAAACGMTVDLLLGPSCLPAAFPERVRVFRFNYYHELSGLLSRKLSACCYDIILHAAAVSDYLCQPARGKISSHPRSRVLRLRRAPKLVRQIRRLNPDALLAIFKLEMGLSDAALIRRGTTAMKDANADLVLANTYDQGRYRGFIIDGAGACLKVASKKAASLKLIKKITGSLA